MFFSACKEEEWKSFLPWLFLLIIVLPWDFCRNCKTASVTRGGGKSSVKFGFNYASIGCRGNCIIKMQILSFENWKSIRFRDSCQRKHLQSWHYSGHLRDIFTMDFFTIYFDIKILPPYQFTKHQRNTGRFGRTAMVRGGDCSRKSVAAVVTTASNRMSTLNLICHTSESGNVKLLNKKDILAFAMSEHRETWIPATG